MAEAHPTQSSNHYPIHSALLCLCKLAYLLYLVFDFVMSYFSAHVAAKCQALGVQSGNTGAQVPHGVQNDKCDGSAGAVARLTSYLFRSDVLPRAQLSIDTHRGVWDRTGAEARTSRTATQRLPDSSLILLRVLLLLTATLSWIATRITAEHLYYAESLTYASI